MKKTLKLILVELSIIILFLIILPAIFIKEKFVINRESGQATFNLAQEKSFSQIITNHPNNFNSISIQLKNPSIKNNSLIIVSINDSQGNLLKDFTFYGANVGDPSWIKLKFPPLNETNYQIVITTENNYTNDDLYLYVDNNKQIDLKSTSYLPGFSNRIRDNLYYQIDQFKQRSLWHNILYLFSLTAINVYLIKLLNEDSKK